MKIFLIILLNLFFVWGCSRKLNIEKTIQEVRLTADYPVIYQKEEIKHLRDSILIYYINKHFIFNLPYFDLLQLQGNTTEVKKYNYFLFSNGSKEGYYIFSDTSRGVLKLTVDSILEKYAFITSSNLFEFDGLKQLKDRWEGKSLVKVFYPNGIIGTGMFDSAYYYFKKDWNFIKFSISKKSDSITQMKLYEERFLFKGGYDSSIKATIPEREIIIKFNINSHPDKLYIQKKLNFLLKRVKEIFPNDSSSP